MSSVLLRLARRLLILLAVSVLLPTAPEPRAQSAAVEIDVDLELVLAVDVSLSMDLEEQRLQRDGYVAAFRDAAVQRAIATGPSGRIAVTYLEWAGPGTEQVVIPWRLIDGAAAAEAFAAELEAKPISRARMTSISSALTTSARLIEAGPFRALRRVIDVSGDGPNNSGGPVVQARAEVLAKGIVINGLPIMVRPSSSGIMEIGHLDEYYERCVIGGPGAFVIAIRGKEEFAPAIRRKLILEISGLEPQPRLLRAQATSTDCTIGEYLWDRYMNR